MHHGLEDGCSFLIHMIRLIAPSTYEAGTVRGALA